MPTTTSPSSLSTQIPSLHSRQQAILIPSPTFWPQHSPLHFYSRFTPSTIAPSLTRHFRPSLHRRLDYLGKHSRKYSSCLQNYCHTVNPTWLPNQPQQIATNTNTEQKFGSAFVGSPTKVFGAFPPQSKKISETSSTICNLQFLGSQINLDTTESNKNMIHKTV